MCQSVIIDNKERERSGNCIEFIQICAEKHWSFVVFSAKGSSGEEFVLGYSLFCRAPSGLILVVIYVYREALQGQAVIKVCHKRNGMERSIRWER